MSRTAQKDVEMAEMVDPKVHTMIRYIASNNVTIVDQGVWASDEVDAHVSGWIEKGYTLHSTHYIGNRDLSQFMQGLSGYGLAYIFVKNE